MPDQKQIIKQQKWPDVIVLVRHGESEYNAERKHVDQGLQDGYSEKMKNTRNADIALTKHGIAQAKLTGAFLKEQYRNFDAVFVSPFQRAFETAEQILAVCDKNVPKIVIDDRIREKEFGIFHAMKKEEIEKRYSEWHRLREAEGKYYFRPPGGESYPDVMLRLHSFIGTLVRDYRKQNALIVSHSAVMLAFHKLIMRLSEKEILALDHDKELKNCAIIAYRFDAKQGVDGKMVLEYFNKIAY